MSKKSSDNIIWTIKELYEWAVENGCEEYTIFTMEECGFDSNIFKDEIVVDSKRKTVSL